MRLVLLFYDLLLALLLIAESLRYTPISRGLMKYIIAALLATVFSTFLYDFSLVFRIPFLAVLISIAFIFTPLVTLRYKNRIFRQGGYKIEISAVILVGVIYYLSYIFNICSTRWGRGDARAIWSYHAKFLTYPDRWQAMFSNSIDWSHPDYPWLLPSVIAMFWAVQEAIDPLVPCILGYLFFLLVPLVLYYGFAIRGIQLGGLIAVIALATVSQFAIVASFQGADVILSLFFLIALVIETINAKRLNNRLLLLTGLMVGLSGWVKNEGIAFALIFLMLITFKNRKTLWIAKYYWMGAALPMIFILGYKVFLTPSNDIVAGQNASTLERLFAVERYRLVASFFTAHITEYYKVLGFIILPILTFSYPRLADVRLLILLLLLAVYFFIFIITPRDLYWHLDTAADRLILQLLPALIFVLVDMLLPSSSLHS